MKTPDLRGRVLSWRDSTLEAFPSILDPDGESFGAELLDSSAELEDAALHGLGVSLGGERISLADFYERADASAEQDGDAGCFAGLEFIEGSWWDRSFLGCDYSNDPGVND